MKYHDRLYNELYRRAITEPNNRALRDRLAGIIGRSVRRTEIYNDHNYRKNLRNYKKNCKSPYNKEQQYKGYYEYKSLLNSTVYDDNKGKYNKPYKHPHFCNCWRCGYAQQKLKDNRRVKYANNLRYKQLEI